MRDYEWFRAVLARRPSLSQLAEHLETISMTGRSLGCQGPLLLKRSGEPVERLRARIQWQPETPPPTWRSLHAEVADILEGIFHKQYGEVDQAVFDAHAEKLLDQVAMACEKILAPQESQLLH